MASSQTFNIIQVQDQTNSGGEQLVLLIQPQPTTVNGQSVTSPYSMPYTISSPTAAQKSAYVYGATITLTTNT